MRRFNDRGEIINTNRSVDDTGPNIGQSPLVRQFDRSRFLTTTSIASPVIYSIVGIILNPVLELGWDSGIALVLGAVFGLIVTSIYNFSYAKEAYGEPKDYVFSLGIPGVVLVAIAIGIVILIAAIIIFVIIGLLSGGG